MIEAIIIFILILGVVIFVHELGHFVLAKRAGAKVEEFGFGFPPRLFSIKKGETIYSINLIPLGGFVKIFGEAGEEENNPKSFANKSLWTKAKIISAGVIMNFLLAIILLIIGNSIGIPTVVDGGADHVRDLKIQIISVSKGSPAEEADLRIGDEILNVDGKEVEEIKEVQDYIKAKAGSETMLVIKRGDTELKKKVIPRLSPPEGEGVLGVGLVKTGIISYPFYKSIWKGIESAFYITFAIVVAFFNLIKNLIIYRTVTAELSGPVGIAVMTGQVAEMGLVYLLQFTAILNINLAIINILPFPALDGGRLLFLAIARLKGKPVSKKIENIIHTIGFALLILLMLWVTFKDIVRFKESFFGLWERIKGLF